jgi:hypothetical protein
LGLLIDQVPTANILLLTAARPNFQPQFEMLMPYLLEPEGGRVHFAGEHTSLKHAWIEGAIESGVRTALAVSEGRKPAAVQLGITR